MMTENPKLRRFFTVEYKGTIYYRFDTYGPEYTVWLKVDKADQVDNVEVYNFLETAYKRTNLDIIKECRQTGKTRTTTKNLLEKAYYEQMTNEVDISTVLIDGDTATIMGVKYKRVEPPKPQTLYEIFCAEQGQFINREVICDIVKKWLPDEVEVDTEEYNAGWNDCLQHLKENLK